jgi:small subunit ribosomal protein S8
MIASLSNDYLIRLKNASQAGRATIVSPYSKYCQSIAEVLKKNGFIKDYQVIGEGQIKQLQTELLYINDLPKITNVEILSRPSRHLYSNSASLPWGINKDALIIISTSSGLLSQKEASKKRLGGELVAQIY